MAIHAQCCMCGKKGLSRVEGDGGPECQLSDGRWTCSADCYYLAAALLETSPTQLKEQALHVKLGIDSQQPNVTVATRLLINMILQDDGFADGPHQ